MTGNRPLEDVSPDSAPDLRFNDDALPGNHLEFHLASNVDGPLYAALLFLDVEILSRRAGLTAFHAVRAHDAALTEDGDLQRDPELHIADAPVATTILAGASGTFP